MKMAATPGPGPDPRRLYREIVEVEKQLRELLRSNPLNAQDANAMRSRLIDSARALAQSSPTFAAQRELEQVLWKPCFYKRIEDFRRRIRKYASAPANDRNVREHFARVSHEFQEFLNDASSFYESLRAAFTKWLLQHRVGRIASNGASAAPAAPAGETQLNIDKCRTSLHRCLIFLGDLARYRELHSQKAKKNFGAAESYYHKALAVIPENGNPHNQLAVLATYVEAETVAVYRYCRSLLIAQPFATAEENLALLFERSRQRPLAPPSVAVISANTNSKDKAAFLKSFLHRLTRMHGVLFSLASPSSSSSSNATAVPVYSKEMESLLMKELATLLPAGMIGDALLLKLVVTNIFCLVRSAGTQVLDDALRLSVRLISVVIGFVIAEIPKMDVKKPGSANSDPSMPNALRLLGAVSTFSDFLRLNTRFLDELDTMVTRPDDADVCKRSAKEFLENLAKLLNHNKVQAVVHSAGGGESARALVEMRLQLKENVELRGFKPLSALVDAGAANKWRDDLAASGAGNSAQTPAVVSDQDAWKTRAWNVHGFGKFLCEDYEGNPLLYSCKGQFSTSPSVVSGIANGFTIAPPTSSSMGLFGVAPAASTNGASLATNNGPVDDFDDEIIVYQPSPALAPSQPRGEGSSALGGAANSLVGGGPLSSPFGSDPFSLGPSASPFGNGSQSQQQQPAPLLQQRLSLSSPSSVFGSFGGTTGGQAAATDKSAIGASLGYGGFQSFGNLGSGSSFGGENAFSGQGFLSAGWGNNAAAAQGSTKSPVTSLAGTFASNEPQQPAPSSLRGSFFDDMDDLAAVERESALYQEKESSLSAFFGAQPILTPSKTMSAIRSPATASASMPPLPTTRSASLGGGRMAPPPGFGATAAPSPPGLGNAAPQQPPQQFFTRNPFANP